MIRYGICVGNDPSRYTAKNFLSEVHYERRDQTSICKAYNSIMDECPKEDTLVLLHEDLEIIDQKYFETKVLFLRTRLDVAIIGAVGALGVHNLQWWDGDQLIGFISESRGPVVGDFMEGYVDAVDGSLLILTPWALSNLRFDEVNFPHFHGYDVDICIQARRQGKSICAGFFELFHRTRSCSCEGKKHDCGWGDSDLFDEANRNLLRKWGTSP